MREAHSTTVKRGDLVASVSGGSNARPIQILAVTEGHVECRHFGIGAGKTRTTGSIMSMRHGRFNACNYVQLYK